MPTSTEATPQRGPRRRKVQKTAEKENDRGSTVDSTNDRSKPRSRKTVRRNDMVLKESLADDYIAIELLSSSEDAALARVKGATSSDPFWERHASLAERVIQSSQSLCQKRTSSLLLEEHEADLLSICRANVKDATEQTSSAEPLKLLYVAIHGLRAICPLLTDTKRIEATMRILYHAATTASDVCTKSKDLVVCVDATSQSLAAFQALGSLLNGYKVQGDKELVTFKWKTSKANLFPVPSLSSSSKGSGGAMTVNQVYKIAMQATLSVSSALAHIYSIRLRKGGNVSCINDFGPYTSEIIQQTASYETILRIVQEVTIPWTCFLSNEVAPDELIEDSLAYAKRVFRLLFDTASQIDKCVSQSPSRKDMLSPADSLLLRKQAILAYLLTNNEAKLSRKTCSAVKQYHWEGACLYACKASVAYQQHRAKNKRVRDDECLVSFHQDVGEVLDSFATGFSLSYVEYSAYRALHTSGKTIGQGDCESNDCAFAELGFHYQHGACFSLKSLRDTSNSSAAAGHATLAVFFLVLVMKGELDVLADERPYQDKRQIDRSYNVDGSGDEIITRFRSVLVEGADFPPFDVMYRCHKLLEALGLNRKMYLILSKSTPECSSRATLTALETSGRVLAECIGPLAVTIARCRENKQQQKWELAIDCFVRGLAVFDRVHEHQLQMEELSFAKIYSRTDDTLRRLFELCHDSDLESQLSEETLDKAAKV